MIATATLTRVAGAALLAATCLFGAVAPALAATGPSKSVSYADLDLSRDADRIVLEARVKSAARSVCRVTSNDLQSRALAAKCVKTAIANARRAGA